MTALEQFLVTVVGLGPAPVAVYYAIGFLDRVITSAVDARRSALLSRLGGSTVNGAAVYVAGPMTGMPEFNYPAFFSAARVLEAAGFVAINPARADGREGCKSWLDFMRASLLDIAACDGIATLPGWGDSRGAALEVHIARSLDLPVRTVDEWLAS